MGEDCADCRRRVRNREARRRNPVEAPAIGAAVRRMLTGLTRRGDEWALIELHALAAEVDDALGAAARDMADRQSWGDVGKYLGMTRQGARQRWALRAVEGAAEGDGQLPGQTRIG